MDFPKSVGFIVDGNRRFAKENGLTKREGHKRGADKLIEVLSWIKDTEVENVVAYLFSTENWKREGEEVSNLMDLFEKFLNDTRLIESGYSIRIIGQRHRFSQSLQIAINAVEKATAHYKKKFFAALSYGGRDEITQVCNTLIQSGKKSVEESDISSHLYTKDLSDIDLIVRTGGRHSLSNFLIWQAAYAELYVTDTMWPALTKEEVFGLFEKFSVATRKMGS